MKSVSVASPLSPAVLGLAVLLVIVLFFGLTGRSVRLLASVRLDIVLVVVIGMAICAAGGIGRIAATSAWSHPLAILAYLLGGLILIIAVSVFAGWKLPLIVGERQALAATACLTGAKVVISVAHSLLARG